MCEHLIMIQVNQGFVLIKAFFINRTMFYGYSEFTNVYSY